MSNDEMIQESSDHNEMEIRFCCGRDWQECPCEEESEVE